MIRQKISRFRFQLLCAGWFLLLGPGLLVPAPSLWATAYGYLGAPAILAGCLFAQQYLRRGESMDRFQRAVLGGVVALVSGCTQILPAFLIYFLLKNPPDNAVDLGLTVLIGFGSAPSLAAVSFVVGSLCGGLIPGRLLATAEAQQQSVPVSPKQEEIRRLDS